MNEPSVDIAAAVFDCGGLAHQNRGLIGRCEVSIVRPTAVNTGWKNGVCTPSGDLLGRENCCCYLPTSHSGADQWCCQ